MLQEIYMWLEQYSGVSYDFNEDISNITGNKAFIDPFEWHISIENILERLNDALSTIDKYHNLLTEDLPNRTDLKKYISGMVLNRILNVLNDIKLQLHIEQSEINSYDELIKQVMVITQLIDMMVDNTLEDIIKNNMFEKYDEENDNVLTDMLNMHKNDVPNIHFTVSSIRQDYFDSLED